MKDPKDHIQPEEQDALPAGNGRDPEEADDDEKAVRVGDDVLEPDPEGPA